MLEFLESRQLLAATVYVAPRGDDANPGTRALPWRTIQHAADVAKGGQTVVILAGTYKERVTIHVGGSKKKGFVTFRGNAGAAISGDGVMGSHQIYISGRQYVAIQGLELMDNTVEDDGSAIRLEGWGHKIRISGNTIHGTRGTSAMAVTVYGSDRRRAFSSVAIDDNNVYDCEPAPSEAIVVNGNVRDFSIRGNDVRDVNNIAIDAIGGEGVNADPALDAARNGTIADNVVRRARSNYEDGYAAGIYVDGGRDIVLERNDVRESDMGMEIGAENAGINTTGITVRDNVLALNDKAGLAIGGYDASVGRVTGAIVRNNTFITNDTMRVGNGEIWVQYANDNTFTNNAVLANSQGLVVNAVVPTAGNRFDFNAYWTTSSRRPIFGYDGAERSFANWRAIGFDASGAMADLKLAADYDAKSGSPLTDAGDPAAVVGSGERAVDGDLRKRRRIDIGAFEQ